jgi:hypothetical protein
MSRRSVSRPLNKVLNYLSVHNKGDEGSLPAQEETP